MQKPHFRLSSLLCGALAVCALTAPARAQDPTSPPPANLSPPANSSSGPVLAGGAIGIGALQWLNNGGTDAEFVYDQPVFHIEAGLGFAHVGHANNNTSDTNVRFGVGGWYHLARGSMADFSVGGDVRMIHVSTSPGGSGTNWALEPGAEARIFLSPNFAFSGRVGFSFSFGDNQDTVRRTRRSDHGRLRVHLLLPIAPRGDTPGATRPRASSLYRPSASGLTRPRRRCRSPPREGGGPRARRPA